MAPYQCEVDSARVGRFFSHMSVWENEQLEAGASWYHVYVLKLLMASPGTGCAVLLKIQSEIQVMREVSLTDEQSDRLLFMVRCA